MGKSLNGSRRGSATWSPPRVSDSVVAERPDPLTVRSLRVGLLLLVESYGELNAETVIQLTSAVQGTQGITGVLVDLRRVTRLDRAAADEIMAAHERLGWVGRRMTLLCPDRELRRVLERSGVTDVVPAFADPDAAIEAA
jgi:anti-anti-sigma regulatory factor